MRLLFAAGSVAAVGLFIAGPRLGEAMKNPALPDLVPLYAVYLLFFISSEAAVQVFIARGLLRTAVLMEVSEAAGRAALLVVPVFLTGSLRALVAAVAAFAVLRFLAFSLVLRRSFPPSPPGEVHGGFVREQLRYGIPLALTQIVSLLGGVFDRAIIALSFGPEQYAIYAVGAIELPLDTILQGSVANVVRATVPALARDGKREEIVRILRAAIRKLSLVVIPVFGGMLTFSREIILVAFTARYTASVDIFRIYLFLLPLQVLILSPLPQSFGRTRINLWVAVVGVLTKATLSILFLRLIGYRGPAVATVLTAYVTSGVFFWFVLQLLNTRPADLLPLGALFRVGFCALAAAAAAKGAACLIGPLLPGLVVGGTIYGLTFAGLALSCGIVEDEDKALAMRLLSRLMVWRDVGG
jgi:O-antigen/teichoic acid export membrane protein